MAVKLDRAVFTVSRSDGGWVVESAGIVLDHRIDKEEAKAAANRRAREAQDAGRPCMVRMSGETGYL